MKNKEYINQQIKETFNVIDAIEKVEVNHFFKHKILQKLNAEKEEKKTVFSWFTPQLQLATLSVLLLLNLSTVFYVFNNSNSNSDIETFAKEYFLHSENTFILN